MLNYLIDFSLKHRALVILAALLFAGVGVFSLQQLDIDAFPDNDSGSNSNQHGRPFARVRRDRASDYVSGRAGDQRVAGPA